jgi:hypothetical protein
VWNLSKIVSVVALDDEIEMTQTALDSNFLGLGFGLGVIGEGNLVAGALAMRRMGTSSDSPASGIMPWFWRNSEL